MCFFGIYCFCMLLLLLSLHHRHPPSFVSSSLAHMGNCLIRNSQISARNDDDDDNYHEQQPRESEVDQPKKKTTTSDFSLFESEEPPAAMPKERMMIKKKMVKKKMRFELQKDEEEGIREETRSRRSGSVRIKLVVTQEELKRILTSNENDTQRTTLEQLLSSVKLRGSRRICQVIGEDDGGGAINAWRPTLESIPEDQ